MVSAAPLGGSYDPASFRDPASRVFHADGDVYRTLSTEGLDSWRALRDSPCLSHWMSDGRLVATEELSDDDGSTYLKHQRIPFWTHPYEWSFSMLRDAALLHLDLLEESLRSGLTMKDATPYNIQFVDLSPIFVDVGSFSRYETGEPWLGYRQFCQQFLYPLLLRAHADVPFQPLLRGSLDGITPATARAFLRSARAVKPGVMIDVVLQARADRSTEDGDERDVRSELSAAGFNAAMIIRNVRRLRKVIEKTRWSPGTSTWSDYASCDHVADQRAIKEAFVRQVAGQRHRRLVWDLGANDAHFSAVAADTAEVVIAMDADEVTVDNTYRRLKSDGPRNVLPLVMNLADPSPGLGWRGTERAPLEDRGTPDLVLMLAVIHHLVIGSNLPLVSVIDWLATLGADVVLEWVPLDDPMSKRLTANKRRHEVHADYSEQDLRRYCSRYFSIATEQPCETRRLFHLTPLR